VRIFYSLIVLYHHSLIVSSDNSLIVLNSERPQSITE